jgi:hypothetical protein
MAKQEAGPREAQLRAQREAMDIKRKMAARELQMTKPSEGGQSSGKVKSVGKLTRMKARAINKMRGGKRGR